MEVKLMDRRRQSLQALLLACIMLNHASQQLKRDYLCDQHRALQGKQARLDLAAERNHVMGFSNTNVVLVEYELRRLGGTCWPPVFTQRVHISLLDAWSCGKTDHGHNIHHVTARLSRLPLPQSTNRLLTSVEPRWSIRIRSRPQPPHPPQESIVRVQDVQ